MRSLLLAIAVLVLWVDVAWFLILALFNPHLQRPTAPPFWSSEITRERTPQEKAMDAWVERVTVRDGEGAVIVRYTTEFEPWHVDA